MGLTIRCRKTGRSMDMGGGGFLRLRRKVAELAGGPFVPVYQEVCAWYPGSNGETAEEFDARIGAAVNEMLAATVEQRLQHVEREALCHVERNGWRCGKT